MKSFVLLAAAQAVNAHFGLTYPEWRADTLSEEGELKYSQWEYPCAGVDYKAGNVTEWPLTGGSLELELHHPWTYVFVNLGLGENSTNFNISLTPELWNATGKGTLCVSELKIPQDVADGTVGTLQVVTSGESGSALYNCADIKFSKDAKPKNNCTSKGVTTKVVNGQSDESNKDGKESTKDDTKKSAVGKLTANNAGIVTAVGLAMAFGLGLGM